MFELMLTAALALEGVDPFGETPVALSEKVIIFTPCSGNGSMCNTVVLLRGEIDRKAEAELKNAVELIRRENPSYPVRVAFNSPGGSLISGLRIGEYLRHVRADTLISNSYTVWWDAPEEVVVDSEVVCYSACFYAFLGGVKRSAEVYGDEIPLGIHQFSGGTTVESSQIVSVLLAKYAEDLNVDRRVIDWASLVPPDEIRLLSKREANGLNVLNEDPPLSPWVIRADGGDYRLEVSQRRSGRDCEIKLTARVVAVGRLLVSVGYGPLRSCSPETIRAVSLHRDRIPALGRLAFESPTEWIYDPNSDQIRTSGHLSIARLRSISGAGSQSIRFDPSWGSGFYWQAPMSDISNDGLSDGLKLIDAAFSPE